MDFAQSNPAQIQAGTRFARLNVRIERASVVGSFGSEV